VIPVFRGFRGRGRRRNRADHEPRDEPDAKNPQASYLSPLVAARLQARQLETSAPGTRTELTCRDHRDAREREQDPEGVPVMHTFLEHDHAEGDRH
jgi:hypothetical protein